MKKIMLFMSAIIGFIIFIILLIPTIRYKIKIRKEENKLLKFYNLETIDGISKSVEFDYIKREPPNAYNITELVDYYILQLKDILDNRIGDKDIWNNERLMISDDMYYYVQLGYDYSWYVDNNNIDISYAKKDLEKKLLYTNNEWFIPINTDSTIELVEGYYITYDKKLFEKLDNVKRVINIDFVDKVDFDSEKYKEKAYDIMVTYIDINNKKQKQKRSISYNFIDKLWNVSFNGFYFNYGGQSVITLHHHTYDKEKEEEEKRMNDIQTEFQEMMQEYEANLSDEERYFNPAFGD